MQEIRRIEIVVDATHSSRVIELLRSHGVKAYTMFRGVTGAGERGSQYGDEITGVSNNNYILTTCPPEKIDEVTTVLKPLLKRVGGLCIVSEALWLPH